ncbi:hypothetical protein DVH24_019134 [Malus domestica]|uniref:ABC transporter domain-containing protein n=1 Tax=Malus domestica TaxID=3750 RepID=A0A498HXX5_MALDO|nr:hypothetical protein DVH24_019134 [Malus domestica]
MAAALAGDDLARSTSQRSWGSGSKRSWASTSFREVWQAPPDVFNRSGRQDEEEELRWAAIERLPTYDRLKRGMLRQVLDSGKVVTDEVDVTRLGMQDKKQLMESILKILGLDICADIMVGDDMRRGISGGQKKRVTTGEMLVGPAKVLLMDEISTGLDSSTTFQICRYMRQLVHIMDVTMVISLLQPAPETFELFDDLILLSEGQIVYQGPRESVLEFFEHVGFKCPERKGVADFLQEVTSKKDQEQYWLKKSQPYRYISVPEFVEAFSSFRSGQQLAADLRVPYDKSRAHPAALITEKYGISNWELFKACFSREWLLMKRNSFVYIFKTTQITIMSLIAFTVFLRTEMPVGTVQNGGKFFGALFFSLINVMFNGMAELAMTVFRLPVFYKQRDFLFYPAWAFGLPIWVLRIPLSFVESGIWIILTYYTIGFAPSASRFFKQFLAFFGIHQMALSLFRFIAALGRTQVVANTLGTFTLLMVFVLGGFIVAKNDLEPWMLWGYYISPMMYGQNAIVMNEFLDKRWSAPNTDPRINATTVGKVLLKSRGFFTDEYWFWICVGALFGFSLLFNILFVAALTFLNRNSGADTPLIFFFGEPTSALGDSKAVIADDKSEGKRRKSLTVELVANPSIIFMDEPTSGLDARAAAIVMRTVRNTVDTGRTVVCTIHQPSIDIFESFDELLLMKRGGQVIYAGPLGRHSHKLVEYFEAIPGVPKIKDGYNPATWMLEVTAPAVETQLDQIPIWWRWYYWASPVAWTLYGLVTSQVGDKNADLILPGYGTMPLKKFLKDDLGFEYDFLPAVAAAHVGWVLLFFFVFAYGIKFLNFQRR